MIPKESPEGDHQANGEAETAVREGKRQIRANKSMLEEKLGCGLPEKHPLLAWLPRYSTSLIYHYKKGNDGKTAEQRRTGKSWKKPSFQFGERVHYRPAGSRRKKNDFEAKLKVGRFVGYHKRSGAIWVLTDSGAHRALGANRMPESDRWNAEGIDCRGLLHTCCSCQCTW